MTAADSLSRAGNEGWGLDFLSLVKRRLNWGGGWGGRNHVSKGCGLFFATPKGWAEVTEKTTRPQNKERFSQLRCKTGGDRCME